MNTYTGKDEMINGKWYPVTVKADNLKVMELLRKLEDTSQKIKNQRIGVVAPSLLFKLINKILIK